MLSDVWIWISDANNQGTLSFVGSGIVALAVAAWSIYKRFTDKPKPEPHPNVSACDGIAAGRDLNVTAWPGGTAVVATGPVTIGITLEEHDERLRRREQELRYKFVRTASPTKNESCWNKSWLL